MAIARRAVERRPVSRVFSNRKGNPAPAPGGEKFATNAAAQVSRSVSSKGIWNGRDAMLGNLLRLLNSLVVRHHRDDHWLAAEEQVTRLAGDADRRVGLWLQFVPRRSSGARFIGPPKAAEYK